MRGSLPSTLNQARAPSRPAARTHCTSAPAPFIQSARKASSKAPARCGHARDRRNPKHHPFSIRRFSAFQNVIPSFRRRKKPCLHTCSTSVFSSARRRARHVVAYAHLHASDAAADEADVVPSLKSAEYPVLPGVVASHVRDGDLEGVLDDGSFAVNMVSCDKHRAVCGLSLWARCPEGMIPS